MWYNIAMSNNDFTPEVSPEAEAKPEQRAEQKTEIASETHLETAIPVITKTATAKPVSRDRSAKSPELLEIEAIMSEGLDKAYMSMSTEKRREFRRVGEQTANSIQTLLGTGKATVQKIRSLLIKWLKMLPGINKFFLEQEAKIKADRLIDIFKNDK